MSDEKLSLFEDGVIFDEIEVEEVEEVIAPATFLAG
jgi:hypothetical protein